MPLRLPRMGSFSAQNPQRSCSTWFRPVSAVVLAVLLTQACESRRSETEERPDIIVILVDAVRALGPPLRIAF